MRRISEQEHRLIIWGVMYSKTEKNVEQGNVNSFVDTQMEAGNNINAPTKFSVAFGNKV